MAHSGDAALVCATQANGFDALALSFLGGAGMPSRATTSSAALVAPGMIKSAAQELPGNVSFSAVQAQHVRLQRSLAFGHPQCGGLDYDLLWACRWRACSPVTWTLLASARLDSTYSEAQWRRPS